MTATKALLDVSQAVQAASLAGHNFAFAKKKKKTVKDFAKVGITNIVATDLLRAQAFLASEF